MSNTTTDLQTDEEILNEDNPTREDLLTSGAKMENPVIRGIKLRKITAETLTYLWERKNIFIFKDEDGRSARNNPIWSIAEFVYIHSSDPIDVAQSMMHERDFIAAVRELMNNELQGFEIVQEAMPVVESMVAEYQAAQSEIATRGSASAVSASPGKAQARFGKRATSRR
jgi:hypothetical protein